MTIHQLLYLAQLENYESDRLHAWFAHHPNGVVHEKKQRLQWTMKVRALFLFSSMISLFTSKKNALFIALYCFAPVDFLIKSVVYGCAWVSIRLFHPNMRVIGIAGSWGKTTMKMSLATALRSTYRVVPTEGNVNTIMGVALSVVRIPKNTEIFICEMDAFYRGEIAHICRLIQPEVGVVSAIGPMHLERFHDDMQALVRAQFELPEHVKKHGASFLPIDANIPKELIVPNVRRFARAEDVVVGVAHYFHVSIPDAHLVQVEHRNEVKIVNGITIIDDAYNANPAGFQRALHTLKHTKATARILVTPGMIELGAVQEKENKRAAQEAAKICDVVMIVGETNKRALLEGVGKAKKVIWVPSLEAAQEQLRSVAKPGTAVLFENDLTDQYL